MKLHSLLLNHLVLKKVLDLRCKLVCGNGVPGHVGLAQEKFLSPNLMSCVLIFVTQIRKVVWVVLRLLPGNPAVNHIQKLLWVCHVFPTCYQ